MWCLTSTWVVLEQGHCHADLSIWHQTCQSPNTFLTFVKLVAQVKIYFRDFIRSGDLLVWHWFGLMTRVDFRKGQRTLGICTSPVLKVVSYHNSTQTCAPSKSAFSATSFLPPYSIPKLIRERAAAARPAKAKGLQLEDIPSSACVSLGNVFQNSTTTNWEGDFSPIMHGYMVLRTWDGTLDHAWNWN